MSLRIVYEKDGSRTFHVDGREVTEAEAERLYPTRNGVPMFNRAADMHWERENGGRGRYIAQLGDPGEDGCYARSRHEIPDLAKRKGFQRVEKC